MTEEQPKQFRKRPIVIQAYQLTEKKEIQTREGTLFGYPEDWIITGIEGEIYPCGNEIFKKTYEPVSLSEQLGHPFELQDVLILETKLSECKRENEHLKYLRSHPYVDMHFSDEELTHIEHSLDSRPGDCWLCRSIRKKISELRKQQEQS